MKVRLLKAFNSLQTEFAAVTQMAVEGQFRSMDLYDDNDYDNDDDDDDDNNNNNNNSFLYIRK